VSKVFFSSSKLLAPFLSKLDADLKVTVAAAQLVDHLTGLCAVLHFQLVIDAVKAAHGSEEALATIAYCKENMNVCVKEEELEKIAELKTAMEALAKKYRCNAIGIQ